jgi:hypothetical protein
MGEAARAMEKFRMSPFSRPPKFQTNDSPAGLLTASTTSSLRSKGFGTGMPAWLRKEWDLAA